MMLLSLLAFIVTFTGTWLWIRFAGQKILQDIPGPRSSHSRPTVRGGGVVFVSVFLLFTYLASEVQLIPALHHWSLVAVGAMMLVGMLDDLYGLPVLSRLIAQISVAFVLSYPVVADSAESIWLLLPLVFAVVWFINLYNFMDGIDGIATLQAISVAIVMAGLCYWQGLEGPALVFGLLVAVMLGFLFWNFPTSSVFMGDAGSGALGTVFVLLMVFVTSHSVPLLWACLLMMSVFILDASWTLLVRLFSGQKIWTAHKLHAYQILSRRWHSHSKVSLLVSGYNLGWLAPVSGLYVAGLLHLVVAIFLTSAPVLAVCYWLKAGQELPEQS
jgi:Fuc2NAc and GlcNAc transferase